MNQMTIAAILWGKIGEYMVPIHSTDERTRTETDGIIDQRRPSLRTTNESNAMKDLLLGACLCNNATKQMSSDSQTGVDNLAMETDDHEVEIQTMTKKLVGDAADVALYHLCEDKSSIDIENVRKVNPRLNVLPFNSKNKFMITANHLDGQDNVLITLKGAPDFVLSRCSTYKADEGDEQIPITEDFVQSIQQRQEALGKSGYRVIAMLQQTLTKSQYDASIATYNKNKKQQETTSQELDLHGLPANNYCFIGKNFLDIQ